ncbi:6-phosphogluconolactonase [Dysgonomonadaceae bacterium zrk40]|nr:6-phosphogluconolactonase [Dysgonomonadaceae bacterium zrk40]
MNIQIFQSTDALCRAFTQWLKELLIEKGTITIALSGGSTPKSLFDYWAALPGGEIDWKRVKFFWGDERCVPPTHEESNYRMTKIHLFDRIAVPEENIFRMHGENDPSEEAVRYGRLLQQELESENSTPTFDIVMLGMGDDGHTASIFPHQMELWDSETNCVAATHPVSGQQRVSLTGRVINAARNVAFLVTGSNKADKVQEIVSKPEVAEKKYPAARVQPESGNLYWFIDRQAALKLTSGD